MEENLTHEEVFGHLEDAVFNVAEVYFYLGDDELFRKFVTYHCKGGVDESISSCTSQRTT